MKATEYPEDVWKLHVPEFYVSPNDPENWKPCKKCGAMPRIWVFDNGRSAKCICSKFYGPAPVRSQSIMEYYSKHKTVAGFDFDNLSKKWNEYVENQE